MKKELYLDDPEKLLSLGQWVKRGKPIQWLKVYDKNSITVYEDVSYGNIKLVTPEGTNIGTNLAVVGDYTVFGTYYEGTVTINVPYKKLT